MSEVTAERLAELKRQDWPRFSLAHIKPDTGLFNVMGRSGPIGRDLDREAADDLARVSGCTVEAVPISPAARRLLSAAENPEHADLINAYLRHFVPGECPSCGYGMFAWGDVHGSGACSCGWPGTLFHYVYDNRELGHLICTATCNGYDVCDARRDEHELVEETWYAVPDDPAKDGYPVIRRELRCPNPKVPPDLAAMYARPDASPFRSRYRAPLIVRFDTLLWAHPYDVHKRSRS